MTLVFVAGIALAPIVNQLPKLFFEPSQFRSISLARANKLDQHQNWLIPQDSVVLVGDSILEFADQLPIGGAPVVNRAIRGDTISGVFERMRPILDADVRRIILMVGINDIQQGSEMTVLHRRIDRLGQLLCASGKTVHWLSVLPINRQIYRREIVRRNWWITEPALEEIELINSMIERTTTECETTTFVDLSSDFSDAHSDLDKRWTIDGLHLSGRGLLRLADRL